MVAQVTAEHPATLPAPAAARNRRRFAAAVAGGGVGLLSGMIGLGGAEFRLPLIGVFGLLALQAVIIDRAMSLLVVATALPARLIGVPIENHAQLDVLVNLPAGSLAGAYLGATWATRMTTRTLHRVLAILLVLIAAALLATHLGQVHPRRQNRRTPNRR